MRQEFLLSYSSFMHYIPIAICFRGVTFFRLTMINYMYYNGCFKDPALLSLICFIISFEIMHLFSDRLDFFSLDFFFSFCQIYQSYESASCVVKFQKSCLRPKVNLETFLKLEPNLNHIPCGRLMM